MQRRALERRVEKEQLLRQTTPTGWPYTPGHPAGDTAHGVGDLSMTYPPRRDSEFVEDGRGDGVQLRFDLQGGARRSGSLAIQLEVEVSLEQTETGLCENRLQATGIALACWYGCAAGIWAQLLQH